MKNVDKFAKSIGIDSTVLKEEFKSYREYAISKEKSAVKIQKENEAEFKKFLAEE